jgi:hypothetical protein
MLMGDVTGLRASGRRGNLICVNDSRRMLWENRTSSNDLASCYNSSDQGRKNGSGREMRLTLFIHHTAADRRKPALAEVP